MVSIMSVARVDSDVSDIEALKREAGIAACDFVKNGMKLGLGTEIGRAHV